MCSERTKHSGLLPSNGTTKYRKINNKCIYFCVVAKMFFFLNIRNIQCVIKFSIYIICIEVPR